MSFQEGHWGLCKEPRWVKGLAESILSSNGTLLAWDKVFPALSQQVSKTQRLTPPTRDVGSSMAASFTGLAQTEFRNRPLPSETDLGFTRTHFFPPAMTTSFDPHLPPGHDQCLLPASSLERVGDPTAASRGLNTHCALGVSKSQSAHGVYVSSSKSFDLAKVHATPTAHQSETLLVPSLQNRPPDFLTI